MFVFCRQKMKEKIRLGNKLCVDFDLDLKHLKYISPIEINKFKEYNPNCYVDTRNDENQIQEAASLGFKLITCGINIDKKPKLLTLIRDDKKIDLCCFNVAGVSSFSKFWSWGQDTGLKRTCGNVCLVFS